jgi:hypothetical protein
MWKFQKKLDLKNPKTFNEKIQWLKLYDSTPIKSLLADKYNVREWVKERIGLHPSSWTKYVRVVGRNQSPMKREKGSCHEAPKEFCC